jgi:hypothetical protein
MFVGVVATLHNLSQTLTWLLYPLVASLHCSLEIGVVSFQYVLVLGQHSARNFLFICCAGLEGVAINL